MRLESSRESLAISAGMLSPAIRLPVMISNSAAAGWIFCEAERKAILAAIQAEIDEPLDDETLEIVDSFLAGLRKP